jgi:hypothetical protein
VGKILSALVVGVLLSAAASGEIVFDGMPDDAYNIATGYNVTGSDTSLGIDIDRAALFVPSASGYLTDVWIALAHVTGANAFELWVMTDAQGEPGSTLWGSGAIVDQCPPLGDPVPPLHVPATDGLWLESGTPYYLVVSTADPTADLLWYKSISEITTRGGYRYDLGDWQMSDWGPINTAAFRIAIPEPGTLGMLLVLAGLLRRR